jgi:hypothetical protein
VTLGVLAPLTFVQCRRVSDKGFVFYGGCRRATLLIGTGAPKGNGIQLSSTGELEEISDRKPMGIQKIANRTGTRRFFLTRCRGLPIIG